MSSSEQKKKAVHILGAALIVLGVVIAAVPVLVNRLVETSGHEMPMPMACNTTWKAELIVGVGIIVLALAFVYLQQAWARLAISAALALCGLTALLLPPFWTGLCSDPMMACRMVTLPTLLVTGILVVIIALLYPVRALLSLWAQRKRLASA